MKETPKLRLIEHEDKIYIADGVNVWIYDGKTIEPIKDFVPIIPGVEVEG